MERLSRRDAIKLAAATGAAAIGAGLSRRSAEAAPPDPFDYAPHACWMQADKTNTPENEYLEDKKVCDAADDRANREFRNDLAEYYAPRVGVAGAVAGTVVGLVAAAADKNSTPGKVTRRSLGGLVAGTAVGAALGGTIAEGTMRANGFS